MNEQEAAFRRVLSNYRGSLGSNVIADLVACALGGSRVRRPLERVGNELIIHESAAQYYDYLEFLCQRANLRCSRNNAGLLIIHGN